MSDTKLGLDPYMEKQGTNQSITIRSDLTGQENKMLLEAAPLIKQRAIVCRGTNCFRTVDQDKVVKFSWTSDKRPRESELLHLAHESNVQGVTKVVGYEKLASIEEMRSGMQFPTPHPFRATT